MPTPIWFLFSFFLISFLIQSSHFFSFSWVFHLFSIQRASYHSAKTMGNLQSWISLVVVTVFAVFICRQSSQMSVSCCCWLFSHLDSISRINHQGSLSWICLMIFIRFVWACLSDSQQSTASRALRKVFQSIYFSSILLCSHILVLSSGFSLSSLSAGWLKMLDELMIAINRLQISRVKVFRVDLSCALMLRFFFPSRSLTLRDASSRLHFEGFENL